MSTAVPVTAFRSARVFVVAIMFAVLAVACGSTVADQGAGEGDTGQPVSPTPDDNIDSTPVRTAVDQAVTAFLATSSSDNATAAVEAMSQHGDEQWVPWLLDMLRVQVSNTVSAQISQVLEERTGIASQNRIADMIVFGSWAQDRGLDGGDDYRAFKASLYAQIDPAFGPLLDSVESQLELAGIQWGGVPLGGIPELNNPERVPADQADWMVDDEIILGVIANGEAVAYPLRILARHELANDQVGGDRLAIVYCTLCRSALVFEREVGDNTLTFLTSGLLLNSNKIMYDRETGSLWSHLRAVGIGGAELGTRLRLRPVNHMRWSDWVAQYPNTEVLALPPPIFFDDPERPPIAYDYTPGEAYRSYYEDEELWFPVLDAPDVFSLKTEVVGIAHNGDAVAFDLASFTSAGETVTVEVGAEVLTIEPTGVGVRVFDADGQRIITDQSFWFAWFANHPDTRTLTFD